MNHYHLNRGVLQRARHASVAFLIMLAVASCGGSDKPGITDPNTTLVEMPGNAFSPFNAIVKVNGTVSFDFPGDEHDVTFVTRAGAPANIPVTKNRVVTRTFTVVGVFPYDCKVHPGMSAQITVTE
ncbi:MAG TPA: hypothetical protein VM053_09165 [Gemmatimonadaceae bacterium]|nr:hypothetical protein [Gemmatimonadaceae bacterium]